MTTLPTKARRRRAIMAVLTVASITTSSSGRSLRPKACQTVSASTEE
jgi:hypothetical protein